MFIRGSIIILLCFISSVYSQQREFELIKFISPLDTAKLVPFSTPLSIVFTLTKATNVRFEFWEVNDKDQSSMKNTEKIGEYNFSSLEYGNYSFNWYPYNQKLKKQFKGRVLYRIFISNKLYNQHLALIL